MALPDLGRGPESGRNWGGFGLAYFDDTMYPDNALFMGSNNLLIQKVYALPGFRDMYLRRVRTLIDAYVKPPGRHGRSCRSRPRGRAVRADEGGRRPG